jgi:cytosine/adenosine deaminase-related metal-dependent hydrolase
VVEFNEMVQRHGKTPIAWMKELGVLGRNTMLGHAIIIGGSSWTNYPRGDIRLMAEAGCSVAHAVWVFARRGVAMESFGRYREAGRQHVAGHRHQSAERDRGHALGRRGLEDDGAEHGGDHRRPCLRRGDAGRARALCRDDLGRIAPGAKADLVLWKASSWRMTPLRDPVKNIVYNASDEDVDRVYVNGRLVVDGGRVQGADDGRHSRRAPGRRRSACGRA